MNIDYQIGSLTSTKNQLQKELDLNNQQLLELQEDLKETEKKLALSSECLQLLSDILKQTESYLVDFSNFISEGLNLIFEKDYTCTLELKYVNEIPVALNYTLVDSGIIINEIEQEEGASLQNVISMLCLYYLTITHNTNNFIFFDEPASNLSSKSWEKLQYLLKDISNNNNLQTVVISHHFNDTNLIQI